MRPFIDLSEFHVRGVYDTMHHWWLGAKRFVSLDDIAWALGIESSKTAEAEGSKVFEIPGGRSLTVAPQEFQNNRIALKVRLTEREKPLLDTTVTVPNKGNFLYVGGPPHEGGNLVLSISAAAQ